VVQPWWHPQYHAVKKLKKNMLGQEEYAGAEDSLKWAARTYLVAALGALASLLYWAYRILGSRD
jgi:Zn-dependent membrane protease YugP